MLKTHQPTRQGGFVNQILLILGEWLTLGLQLPGISWFSGPKCSPCKPVFCYYQDCYEKLDKRSLSQRGYHVSLTVWGISWSKGYSIPLLTPVIPAPFGQKNRAEVLINKDFSVLVVQI